METSETRAKLASAIRELQTKGDTATIDRLVSAYKVKYKSPTPVATTPVPKRDTLIPSVQAVPDQPVRNVIRTFANIPSSAERLARTTIAPVNPFDTESPLNIGANIVKGIGATRDIIKEGGLVKGSIDVLTAPKRLIEEKGIDILRGTPKVAQNVIDRGVGNTIVEGISQIAEKGIEDPLLIPSIIYAPSKVRGTGVTDDVISTISKTATQPVVSGINATKSKVGKLLEPTTQKLESIVIEQFEKGVKPLINARITPTQAEKYKESIVDAVRLIDSNKPNISYVDEVGEVISGRNPQTLQELSDAQEQVKKIIFKQYDDLAKQAGNEGLKIDTTPIANELDTVINNEALQISNPTAIKYAQDLKERLSFRKIDAKVAQDVIQNYNDSLKAFYRNPSYDNASKASIDAFIVNKMRQSLDEGITGLTGVEYQALKNQYGSLKTIEKDITKAALRDARKNNKSLLDYTDILTGGDIITSILTLNPAQLARGLTARGIKEWYKYLNSPNRAVKKLFESTEKLNQRLPKSQSIPSNIASPTAESSTLLRNAPSESNTITPTINANIPKTIPQSTIIVNKAVDKFKNTPNKQGGFVKIPGLGENQRPSPKVSESVSSLNNTTKSLVEEAKKYKSAEEFVNSLKLTDQSSSNTKVASLAKNVGVENFGGVGVFQLPQVKTSPEVVKMWETKISAGERPIIYAGSQGGFPRLVDGNNRLQAYKNLGFKEVPTVQPSQLTDIWNKANKK